MENHRYPLSSIKNIAISKSFAELENDGTEEIEAGIEDLMSEIDKYQDTDNYL